MSTSRASSPGCGSTFFLVSSRPSARTSNVAKERPRCDDCLGDLPCDADRLVQRQRLRDVRVVGRRERLGRETTSQEPMRVPTASATGVARL